MATWWRRLRPKFKVTAAGLTAVAAVAALLITNWLTLQELQGAAAEQASERFSRDVTQLASGNEYSRVGAVYSLGRLMNEDPDNRRQAFGILTSFVRERVEAGSPVEKREREAKRINGYDVAAPLAGIDGGFLEPPRVALPADIAAAMTVLNEQGPLDGMPRLELDLSWYDLRYAEIGNLIQRGPNREAEDPVRLKLQGADLRGAQLANVDLYYAELQFTWFTDADLTDADMEGAFLQEAVLHGATLTRTDLELAKLSGTDFLTALLPTTKLGGACADVNPPTGQDPRLAEVIVGCE